MKALAQVAGSVAPALADLLSIISGRTSQVLDSPGSEEKNREAMYDVYAAAERALGLLRHLLLFSGRHPLHEQVLELNTFIEDSSPLLRRVVGDGVEVEFRPGSGLPLVMADASMLEQVLLGLTWNARDAMPDGGRLVITTTAMTLSEAEAKAFPDGRPGHFVAFSLGDTGSGIAPEVLPRIFEPFFTTRDAKRYLGLGLAAAFGIVQRHGGWLTVETKVGAGSQFTVFLPAATTGARLDTPQAGARPGAGGETILLLDDEEPVREFAAIVLRDLGYQVLETSSSKEALDVWRAHRSEIDLLISDVVLEGSMTGVEVANTLCGEKPDLGVILISGYDREILGPADQVQPKFQFLQKPWRPQTFARTVRLVLDSRSR